MPIHRTMQLPKLTNIHCLITEFTFANMNNVMLTHDNPKDGSIAKDGNDDHDGEEGVPEEGRG